MRKFLFPILTCGAVAISACSTQGVSRYGDTQASSPQMPCGPVMVPCGQIVEYHRIQVQPPAYLVPVPCPTGQCLPPEPPVIEQPPIIAEQPVIVEPPYVPPVIAEPPYEPPVIVEPPVLRPPPPVSCPPGTIPGYGGQDCIPITVPRK